MVIKTYIPQLRPEFMFDDYNTSVTDSKEEEGSKEDFSFNEQVMKGSISEEDTSLPHPPSFIYSKSATEEEEEEEEEEHSQQIAILQTILNWFRSCIYCQHLKIANNKNNNKKRRKPSEEEMNNRHFKQSRVSSSKSA